MTGMVFCQIQEIKTGASKSLFLSVGRYADCFQDPSNSQEPLVQLGGNQNKQISGASAMAGGDITALPVAP